MAWLGGDGGAAEQAAAFRGVVLGATTLTLAAGALVYGVVPEPTATTGPRWRLADVLPLARRPTLWLQGVIVVCAYVAYKGTDDVSLLVRDVLGYTELEAASVGTLSFWLRPVSAVAAGLVADRLGGWRTVAAGFALLLLGDLAVVSGITNLAHGAILAGIVATGVAVYALRGVYFALLAEGGVPVALTGTAVGVVSVIGYTPDVFFGPLMGALLDGAPGAQGHRHLFVVLGLFAAVGLVASLGFGAMTGGPPPRAPSTPSASP